MELDPSQPVVPDYAGACLANVVPALLHRASGASGAPPWLPAAAGAASQVVLLALDGVGWQQLCERRALAPVLCGLDGGPITTVVPSTTATCLTSLTTGLPPGVHGVIGYRVHVGGGSVLNVLRWRTPDGDAVAAVPPEQLAPQPAFEGVGPPVVTRAEFSGGGFSRAHLRGARVAGWRMPSTLVEQVRSLVEAGEPFVYAYYDGVDKVAHEFGLGRFYDAELAAADRLVADLLAVLPDGVALVVTSDHGQVDVGRNVVALHDEVMRRVWLLSGEGRFRWLHARPGTAVALAAAAAEHHGGQAWVRTRDEAVEQGWFGPPTSVTAEAIARMGDVVLAARDPVAFLDPADLGEVSLVSRHGSLTAAEMLVPLLAGARRG